MSEYIYREIWHDTMESIHEEYKSIGQESQFLLWFNFEYIEDTIDTITVGVPSDFMWKKSLDKKIPEKICSKIKELTGQQNLSLIPQIKNIQISDKESVEPEQPKTNENISPKTEKIETQKPKEEKIKKSKNPTLDPSFTFENFISNEGSASNFAYKVAVSVAENPGTKKNPILLYGGVGLGKTHLMQAIGNKIQEDLGDSKKICYIQAESFLNEFTNSMVTKSQNAFKNKYRKLDVLLLDDIHFFTNKPAVQEELFYTFEALKNSKSQMVFTCDRPLKEIEQMAERLVSRLGSGMCLNLDLPSYETRKAIVYKKLENSDVLLSEEIIDFIARTIETNIRDLESAITKITGYQEYIPNPITIEQAQQLLNDFYTNPKVGNISPENIKKVVSETYQVSLKELTGTKRTNQIATARHIAFYLTREMTELSLADIGNEFGGKDHSSVINGIKRIEEKIKTDSNLNQQIQYLKKLVKEYKK